MKSFNFNGSINARDIVHIPGNNDVYDVTENNGTLIYTSKDGSKKYTLGTSIESLRFNKPNVDGKTKFTWEDQFSTFTPKGIIDNPFVSTTEAMNSDTAEGMYYFKNNVGQIQQLFYKDGWVLIASNNAKSSIIPSSTDRNNLAYTVHRNHTLGALGSPNPEEDYIIGDFISNFSFTKGRILGWGRGSTNGTYTLYPSENLGEYVDVQWNVTTLTAITPRDNVTVFGNGTLHASAAYFILDSVALDVGLNANSNQSTVGGAGVASSSGDSSLGCYLGHGASEGNFEGWYNTSGNANSQGYTTWVKS